MALSHLLDPIRPYLWAAKVLGLLILVAFAFVGGCRVNAGRLAGEQTAHKATKQAHADMLADLAEKTEAAAQKAKAASKAVKAAREENDARFKQALAQAEAERIDLRDRLRSGEQRLQPWWDCPARGDAGGAAADADKADTASRADSASRIVAAAQRDAAVIEMLWNGWSADRQAVIAAGCAVEANRRSGVAP